MAKPYQTGKNKWSVRVRVKGQDIFLSGYATEAAAKKAAAAQVAAIENAGKPAKFGPQRTSVAVAFMDYAREKLPRLKGARQDARRINRYLTAAGLPTIVLTKAKVAGQAVHFEVSFADAPRERVIPNGLHAHRAALAAKSTRANKARAQLARMTFAKVCRADVQGLVDAMEQEGRGVDDVRLEISILSKLFNYALKVWNWTEPGTNPAAKVDRAKADTARNRVLTQEEWNRILKALKAYGNPYALSAYALLLESSMRSSEPLLHATWGNLDWSRCVLHLTDGKTGPRDVPLSPGAMQLLQDLYERDGRPPAHARLLPISYEALKKAWSIARAQAGIHDVRGHDLRHTAATRYALELNGDVPLDYGSILYFCEELLRERPRVSNLAQAFGVATLCRDVAVLRACRFALLPDGCSVRLCALWAGLALGCLAWFTSLALRSGCVSPAVRKGQMKQRARPDAVALEALPHAGAVLRPGEVSRFGAPGGEVLQRKPGSFGSHACARPIFAWYIQRDGL